MSYRKKIYRFKNAIEIEEFHTGRFGAPGEKRREKKKPTPELIERINQKNKEKTCRRKLRSHFEIHDYFSTLTYQREQRPGSMEEAKDDFKRFLREVRREYEKRGERLKWIRNIEVGTKGAWHVHLVINRISDTDVILAKAWKHGKVRNQLLFDKGEFKELAAYMTKTPKTDPRLRETSYSASRNLPVPAPEEKTYLRWKTWKEPKVPKGFYLDKESLYEGVNPLTGYRFRTYTLLRIKRE